MKFDIKIFAISLFVATFNLTSALALTKASTGSEYSVKLKLLQNQIQQIQKPQGEWAGINEGDPRWDVMFMVYTDTLHKAKLKFISDEILNKVISETIYRLKTFRGFQPNGWSLHRGLPVDEKLTGSILLALNHINPDLVKQNFRSQQAFYKKQGWSVSDMSVLDRVLFRMFKAPGYIALPPTINTAMFAFTRDSGIVNMSSLGYYRWGFIALSVWNLFDNYVTYRGTKYYQQPIAPLTDKDLEAKGELVSFPERTSSIDQRFWAREGLIWLLQRPHGDGNPSPTLIVQQAILAAHRYGVRDFSPELQEGWEYMNNLRFPMRNNAKVFQPSISPIWDTARVLSALDHVPTSLRIDSLKNQKPAMKNAIEFILNQQDVDGGDYLMANPTFKPGGWGFAYESRKYPDSDDTAMVVDALLPHVGEDQRVREATGRGVDWLLQMQNEDGGFPAWDYNATGLIEFVIQNTSILPNTSLEPQSDVTARVLRVLKRVDQSKLVKVPSVVFERGCSFLKKSAVDSKVGHKLWKGTWAVNFLYGTSEVLTTLMELNCLGPKDVETHFSWLQQIQNSDGGWGESVASYQTADFARGKSSVTQTLGALQFLLSYEKHRLQEKTSKLPSATNMIKMGVDSYLAKIDSNGDIHDENEDEFTACYACPSLFVRYDLIPLYMGTEVLGKYLQLLSRKEKK